MEKGKKYNEWKILKKVYKKIIYILIKKMLNKEINLERVKDKIIQNLFWKNNLLFLTKVDKKSEIKFTYKLLDNSKLWILQNSIEDFYINILLNINKESLFEINWNFKIKFDIIYKKWWSNSCESIYSYDFQVVDLIWEWKVEDLEIKFKY